VYNKTVLAAWSIPKKLLMLLLVIFLFASGILIASGFSHRRHAVREAESDALLLVESLAAQQEQIAIGTEQMLRTLAQLPEVRSLSPEACNALFRNINNQYPFYSIISAATPEGKMFAASTPFDPGVINLSDRKHFKEAAKFLDFSVGEYVLGKVSKVQSLHYSYPVLDANHNLIAVVSAAFKLDAYARFLTKVKLPEDSAVVIADHAGVRLYRLPENDATASGKSVPEEAYERLSGDFDRGTFEKMAEDGIYRIYAFKQLRLREGSSPYLYMIVGIARDNIIRRANVEMLSYLLILAIAALIGAWSAWVFANLAFIRPINRLVEAARQFGKGNMGSRTGLPHTPDELGQLAASFDDMASLIEVRAAERKETGDALEEANRRLIAIIEFLPDATFVIDCGGKVLAWNRAIEVMTGVAKVDMLQMGNYEYSIPFYGERRPILIDLALSSDPQFELREYDFIYRQGDILYGETHVPQAFGGKGAYLWATASILRDSAGNVVGAIESIRDITERKQAELALAEEALRRRILFEQSRDGIVVLDQYGNVYEANQSFADMIGYSVEEVRALHVWDWDVQWRREELEKMLHLVDSSGDHFETRHRRKDGSFYDVEISTNGAMWAGQKLVYCICRDVSQRKAAENALREREEIYSAIVNQAGDGIVLIDVETLGFAEFNAAAFNGLGYTRDEFAGLTLYDIQGNMTSKEIAERVRSVVETGQGCFESKQRRKDGSLRDIQVSNQTVRIRDRDYLAGIWHDVTDRRQAEEERERLTSQLRQAQKLEAIGTLAGGIAHDFNNILAPIIGYTEMALGDIPQSGPMRHSLEQVLHAAHRAKDLVKQILAFSRYGQNQQRIPVDIGSIAKEALKLLRASLPTTIEIKQSIGKGVALADATQIHQVIVNLCTNAAHAMNDKGVLDVILEEIVVSRDDLTVLSIPDLKPGPYLRLSVADTGHGMDGATMERIFDPYFTTKEVGKGSGLGLAVVHGIVKRHDGAIAVCSEPGKGAVFHVYIPRTEAAPVTLIETRQVLPRGMESILLVDDEKMVVNLGAMMLERLGYSITAKTNALEALEEFRSRSDAFDLVITDYTMPHLTGVELASEILKIRQDIPIILCTGYSERITAAVAKDLGITEFAMKPLDRRQLAEMVRKTLDARKV
jgi:PAS domain S-box-containing protein